MASLSQKILCSRAAGARAGAAADFSGGFQGLITLLPVARAQLVGLQSIQHPQDLLRVAPDIQIVT